MRIITGKYRNKRLFAPDGTNTRPTSDKVRESIFDVLISRYFVEDAIVLDLFSGTGALGIEALSRGAECAVFVDKSHYSAAVTRKNLLTVKEKSEVYNTDWRVALRKLEGRRFDLIFIDPPYAKKIEKEVVGELVDKRLISKEGCIIVEHASENTPEFDETVFDIYRKEYSGTHVTYLSLKEVNDE